MPNKLLGKPPTREKPNVGTTTHHTHSNTSNTRRHSSPHAMPAGTLHLVSIPCTRPNRQAPDYHKHRSATKYGWMLTGAASCIIMASAPSARGTAEAAIFSSNSTQRTQCIRCLPAAHHPQSEPTHQQAAHNCCARDTANHRQTSSHTKHTRTKRTNFSLLTHHV